MLQRDTAKLSIVQHQSQSSSHNLRPDREPIWTQIPTAYPSRRAWLEFVVRDNRGMIVFESGSASTMPARFAMDKVAPIATELAGGPTQPHFDTISNAQQVQIFETFMQDSDAISLCSAEEANSKKTIVCSLKGGAINMHTP